MQTNETKQLTRRSGFEPLTEPTDRGRSNDMKGAPLASLPSVGQCRRGVYTSARRTYRNNGSYNPNSVPVVDVNNIPLMPTTPSRAKKWIKSGEATPFDLTFKTYNIWRWHSSSVV